MGWRWIPECKYDRKVFFLFFCNFLLLFFSVFFNVNQTQLLMKSIEITYTLNSRYNEALGTTISLRYNRSDLH